MSSSSVTFSSLGLSDSLLSSCRQLGLHHPTPIQTLAIPPILKGQNVLGQAKTGSGKSAAFALPILHELSKDPYGIFALVLTPTRELAFQLVEQFRALGSSINVRDCVIIGGLDQLTQSRQLANRPHIVIATPGRLAELLRYQGEDDTYWKYLKFLVLDEADRLLEQSFAPDLAVILNAIPGPKSRQTLLFSATLNRDSPELSSLGLDSPVFVSVSNDQQAFVDSLDQNYLFIPQNTKETYLTYLLTKSNHNASCIIFTSTCKGCQIISELLLQLGVDCVSLHSHKNQARRLAALGQFRAGIAKVLVATDVASRGLDIPQVQLVVNYDVPRRLEDYIHRVGRTARAGRGGLAITMVSQYDIEIFQSIEESAGVKMKEYELPEDKVLELMKNVTAAKHMVNVKLEEFDQVGGVDKKKKRERRQLEIDGQVIDMRNNSNNQKEKIRENEKKIERTEEKQTKKPKHSESAPKQKNRPKM